MSLRSSSNDVSAAEASKLLQSDSHVAYSSQSILAYTDAAVWRRLRFNLETLTIHSTAFRKFSLRVSLRATAIWRFIPQRSGKFSLRVTAIWRVRQRQLSSSTFSDNFHRHRKMRLFLRDDDPKRHLRVENSNRHRKIAWFFCDDIQKGGGAQGSPCGDIQKGPVCRYRSGSPQTL